jgi:8-oxo-dGTP diphosphatase
VEKETTNTIRKRRSARIILLNEVQHVLLIRFVVERQNRPFTFWATPGGGVEHDETDIETARRELKEELGLNMDLIGPVHSHTADFEHEGEMVSNTDIFFVGRCERAAPVLKFATDAERRAMKELKWWSIVEIERMEEVIFPSDLGRVIRAIDRSLP